MAISHFFFGRLFCSQDFLFWKLVHSASIASLISESLPGDTHVNGNSPKVSGYLSLFLHLVLMFFVSNVNLLHIYVSTYPKNDYWCGLSYQLERTDRFASSVDIVLEDYTNCLPNNKQLGVKHVLIVFW